jgi:hypothetical protein
MQLAEAEDYSVVITLDPAEPKAGQALNISGTFSWVAGASAVDDAQVEIWNKATPPSLVRQPRTTAIASSTDRKGVYTASTLAPTVPGQYQVRIRLKDQNGVVLHTASRDFTVLPPDPPPGGGGDP